MIPSAWSSVPGILSQQNLGSIVVVAGQDFQSGVNSRALSAWNFDGSGWGTKYANFTSFSGNPGAAAWTLNESVVAYTASNSNIEAIPFVQGVGFGSKFAASGYSINSIEAVDWSGSESSGYVAGASDSTTSPFQLIVSLTPSGWGSRVSSGVSIGGRARDVRFSPDGADICFSSYKIYQFNNGLGSSYSTGITNSADTVAFSSAGDAFGRMRDGTTDAAEAWPFTSGVGIGSQYALPAVGVVSDRDMFGMRWTPDDAAVVATVNDDFEAYEWSAGFGSKYTTVDLALGAIYGLEMSADGKFVFLRTNLSPYLVAYPWSSASGLGTRLADPAVIPEYRGSTLAVSS